MLVGFAITAATDDTTTTRRTLAAWLASSMFCVPVTAGAMISTCTQVTHYLEKY